MKESFDSNSTYSKIDQLKIIGRFVSGDYNEMKIQVTKNENWYWNFKDNIINIPEKDLKEKSIEELKFLIGHEGAHRKITGGKMLGIGDGNQHLFFLLNAIEDPRVNNYLINNFSNFKVGMQKAYTKQFNSIIKKSKKELGMIPKSMQAGIGYIQQWFREINDQDFDLTSIKDDEVRGVLEKTLKTAQESWWSYPSEDEVGNRQWVNEYGDFVFDNIYKKIWPEYEKLLKKDQENQEAKKLLDKIAEEHKNRGNQQKKYSDVENQNNKQEGNKGSEKNTKQPESKQDINNQQGRGNADSNGQNGKEKSNSKNKSTERVSDDFKKELTRSEQAQLKEFLDNYDNSNGNKQRQGESARKCKGGDSTRYQGADQKLIYDDLPKDLKDKLKEFKGQLSDEQKEELKKQAKGVLEKFEKKISQKLDGEFTKAVKKELKKRGQNSKDEIKKDVEDIILEFNKKKPPKKDGRNLDRSLIQKLNEQNKKILEKDNTKYREVLAEIYPLVNNLEQKLRFILWRKQRTKKQSGFRSGGAINISKVISAKVGGIPADEWKVFERKKKPDKKDYVFSLLIDLSDSMEGKNIDESFKAVVLFSEVLNRIKIPFEINGFNTEFFNFKGYKNKRVDNKTKKEIGQIFNNVGSCTNLMLGLQNSIDNIKKRKENEKIIFVISDGEHNTGESEGVLKKYIKEQEQQRENSIKMVGLGLGDETDYIKQYFTEALANIFVQDIPKELSRLLEEKLKN